MPELNPPLHTDLPRSSGLTPPQAPSRNFGFLAAHDLLLARLGALAELYALSDPNTSVIKIRQLAEALVQQAAARLGVAAGSETNQFDLIRTLEQRGLLGRDVGDPAWCLRGSARRGRAAYPRAAASWAERGDG